MWLGILIISLMLLPFAGISVAGVLIIRSTYRSDPFIFLINPWRDFLARKFDDTKLQKINRIAARVFGSFLALFGLTVVVVFGRIAIVWLRG